MKPARTNRERRTSLRALGALALLGPWASRLGAQERLGLRDWLAQPGTVLMVRHAQTVSGIGDPEGFRLGDCSTQRNLSDAGREDARSFGRWLGQLGLRPAAVRSSQWCRCVDTARLMFPEQSVLEWPALNSYFQGHGNRGQQLDQAHEALQRLRAAQSRFEVWVTHQVVISDLTGEFTGMGEAVVVRAAPSARQPVVLGRSSGPR